MESIIIFCDGCCEPNPGGIAAWGWAAFDGEGKQVASGRGALGLGPEMTNNVAEYQAVIEALKWVVGKHAGGHTGIIRVLTDSKLVVNQVSGAWRCNKEHLARLCDEVKGLIGAAQRVGLGWIPGDKNVPADALSRMAMHEFGIDHYTERLRWFLSAPEGAALFNDVSKGL